MKTPSMNYNLRWTASTWKHTFIAKKFVSRSNSTLLLWVEAPHVNFRQVTPSSLWEYHAIIFGQKVFIILKFEISYDHRVIQWYLLWSQLNSLRNNKYKLELKFWPKLWTPMVQKSLMQMKCKQIMHAYLFSIPLVVPIRPHLVKS